MICVNTCVIARVVVCILSIAAPSLFPLHYELSTMHDPWFGHCPSPWLCMNCIWAENICTSEHANVPMKLRCDGRQHGRRGSLYTTKVKWKIYPTSCTLLDVGFVFILRRTDIFILIWACTAVLPNVTTVIFQIIRALKQNYYVV